MKDIKRTLFVCHCGSLEHSFVVSADEDCFYIEIHLSPLPFWPRVRNALGYVLGRRSKWGDFEEIVLDPYEALTLSDSMFEWMGGQTHDFPTNDVH